MKIQVKEEHIKNGQPENCENCALALAVKDSLKADSVSVTTDCDDNIEISAWFDKLGYKKQKDIIIMDSDRIQVNHFVEAFDSFYDWDGNQSVYNSVLTDLYGGYTNIQHLTDDNADQLINKDGGF